ncbi:AsmA family protein [Psychromonas sp. MME2]|uniref:AsmA family protein n=1 Tax=Psychromonas sp. MME2 TaxID=3231033 RepID=UPI00339CC983
MKIVKYLCFILIAFLVLITAMIAWLNRVELSEHRTLIENQFTEILGRNVKINGDMQLVVSLTPYMLLRDVHIQNASWGSQADMLKAGEAVLALKFIPLLSNKIEVTELSVSDLDMLIETNAQGVSNWELGEAKKETTQHPSSGVQTEILLHQALLQNSHISIKNHAEKELQLVVDKLHVNHIVDGLQEWDIAAKYKGVDVALNGSTSLIHALLVGKPFKMDLRGKLGDFNTQLQGDVALPLTSKMPLLNIDFAIDTPDLNDITQLTGYAMPKIDTIKVTGNTITENGFYRFTLKGDIDQINVHSDGQVAQSLDGQGDAINLQITGPNLQQLGKLANLELADMGPVDINAKVASANGAYLFKLNTTVDDIKVDADGQVSQKFDGKGDNINFLVKGPDLQPLGKLANTELPSMGPIEVAGKASSIGGFYQFKVNADLNKIRLDADGEISQKSPGQGDEINLELVATDLAELGALGQTELPQVGPVNLKAKLNTSPSDYKISELDLKLDNIDLKGAITIERKQPIAISATIMSNLLDLKPFQNDPVTEQEKQPVVAVKSDKVFPSTPLPLQSLSSLNANIDYSIGRLELPSEVIKDLKFVVNLNNSKLLVKPLQAQLQGGTIKGELLLDASPSQGKPLLMVNLDSDKLELGKFDKLKEHISGGDSKVHIALQGSGDSISEIMAGLNGETILDIGQAKLANGTMDLIAGDMIASLISALAPTESKTQGSLLECGVVRFDIKDGHALADKSIALKSNKTVIVGSGEIDLKTEGLGFQISSHSVGFAAIDAGDLTRSVGLGGTLANPKPILDIAGATKTGATIGAAILTLGTSYLAQKLVESVIEDKHPCLTALGKSGKANEKSKAIAPPAATQ